MVSNPSGLSSTLPSFALFTLLLWVCSVPLFRLLMKMLNSMGVSVALCGTVLGLHGKVFVEGNARWVTSVTSC